MRVFSSQFSVRGIRVDCGTEVIRYRCSFPGPGGVRRASLHEPEVPRSGTRVPFPASARKKKSRTALPAQQNHETDPEFLGRLFLPLKSFAAGATIRFTAAGVCPVSYLRGISTQFNLNGPFRDLHDSSHLFEAKVRSLSAQYVKFPTFRVELGS